MRRKVWGIRRMNSDRFNSRVTSYIILRSSQCLLNSSSHGSDSSWCVLDSSSHIYVTSFVLEHVAFALSAS